MVRPAGLEPATTRLEGGCSIQLSYGRVLEIYFFSGSKKWSEWRDSNPRHSAPKADALPGCATLRNLISYAFQVVRIITMSIELVNVKLKNF